MAVMLQVETEPYIRRWAEEVLGLHDWCLPWEEEPTAEYVFVSALQIAVYKASGI